MVGNAKTWLTMMAAVLSLCGAEAASQEVDEDTDVGEVIGPLQGLSLIGITPGVSGAKYSVDVEGPNLNIRSTKFPIRRKFNEGTFCFVESDDQHSTDYTLEPFVPEQSANAICATPYAELTLSRLRADRDVVSDEDGEFGLDFTTLSALAGLGLSFQLTDQIAFLPILLGGYSNISTNSTFEGDGELAEGLQGTLVDGEVDTILFGTAAELRYKDVFGSEVELDGRLRFNHLVNSSVRSSDEVLEGTNDFIVITSRLEASVPTGLKLFSRDLHALGFGGTNMLLIELDELIGGDDLVHEVGGGLELRNPFFLKGLRLRGSVLFGDDVTGWRAGLGIKF